MLPVISAGWPDRPRPTAACARAQEPTLFDDTVLYNIRFGAFEAPVERSCAAAAAAALDDSLARWPHGLETRLGRVRVRVRVRPNLTLT